MLPSSGKITENNYLFDKNLKKGILKLSHENEDIQSFLISGESSKEIIEFYKESSLCILVPGIEI